MSGVELPAVSVPWPLRRSNAGLSVPSFSTRAVGAHVVVDLEALVFADHEVAEEPARPRLAGIHVAEIRERILVGARDLPGLGHLFAVFAHRKAGARLEHAGHHRLEMPRAQAEEGLDAPPRAAAAITRAAAAADIRANRRWADR